MTRSRTIRILTVLALVALGLLLWRTDDDAASQSVLPVATVAAEPEDATPAPTTEPVAEAPAREEAAAPALVASPSEDLVECRFRSGGAFEPVTGTVRLPREPTTEAEPPSYPMAEGVAFLPRAFVAELVAGRDPESLVLEEADGGAAPCIGVEELDPDLYALDFPREVVLEFHVTDLRGEPIEGAEVTVLGQSLLDLNANGPRTDAAGRLTARVRSPSRQMGYRVRKYGYAVALNVLETGREDFVPVEVELGRIFVAAWIHERRYPVSCLSVPSGTGRATAFGTLEGMAGGTTPFEETLARIAGDGRAYVIDAMAEVDEYWDEPELELQYRYSAPCEGEGSVAVPFLPLARADERCIAVLPMPDQVFQEPVAVSITGFDAVTEDLSTLPGEFLFWFEVLDREYHRFSAFTGQSTRLPARGYREGSGYVVYLLPGRYALANPDADYSKAVRSLERPLFLEGEPFAVQPGRRSEVRAVFVPGCRWTQIEVLGASGDRLRLESVLYPDETADYVMAVRPNYSPSPMFRFLVPGDYRLFVYSPRESGVRAVGPQIRFPADCSSEGHLTLRLSRRDFEAAGIILE